MLKNKVENIFAKSIPMPMCSVDSQGKVLTATDMIEEVFLYDGIIGSDIFALTGIKYSQFVEAAETGDVLFLSRNDKSFKILASFVGGKEDSNIAIYFIDITPLEELTNKYREERPCIALVDVDNYEELIDEIRDEERSKFDSEIDKIIRRWGGRIDGAVCKLKHDYFSITFANKDLVEQARSRFHVLDEMKQIETDADFPVTLSIGIGIGGKTFNDTDELAEHALAVSKGRGGDHVTVYDGSEYRYYGGDTRTVEKGNKGKSRIIGLVLLKLIESASNVLIMGHKNPDMDAFGAAIGMYRLAKEKNRDTFIVVNEYNEALDLIYDAAKEKGFYDILNNRKATNMVDESTLVIMVDTHKPSICECPELLEKCGRIVVVDHHRRGAESVENPDLAYIEPYASSTSELVAEILQYLVDRRKVETFEAEALLAGIMVDTDNFTAKAGVRTFEAAAWLKRAGADLAQVQRFFQSRKDTFKIKARGLASAELTEGGAAYAICSGNNENIQVINAQVANELLNIRGTSVSFVAGRDGTGMTTISARSLGDVNVHVVMEQCGGGGHLNTAGAQMEESPEEAIEKIKKIMEETR